VTPETLVLSRRDVTQVLDLPDCIEAVEAAFLRHGRGESIAPGVLGTPVEGGGFHVKAAGLLEWMEHRPVYAAKVNANFPHNPARGLPTIQGVIALFDAGDGRLLALLDSIEITVLRTAAATAVAARHLAPVGGSLTICGCGAQSRSQLRAVASVRRLERVFALHLDPGAARRFAEEMTRELDVEVRPIATLDAAARETTIWVTCTPSCRWFLGRAHVAPGAFVAAVGADNPEKQELEPELLAMSAVVADVRDQCVLLGELHHAIAAGLMRPEDVRGELADVVSGRFAGRRSPEEIIVFDSTGTALQDVAVAARVYQRAQTRGVGHAVALGAA
jgi:ornithine cyclodeaminase/alanine dehydrogenase-like protein (mu-crystallin family)